ncbi:MAG: divergent polysaccharide deacetylase family protein [Candidatus Omnitrophota bacterium]
MQRLKLYRIAVIILAALVIIETAGLIYLSLRVPRRPALKKAAVFKGKIAIVIDDWGYNLNNLEAVSQIKAPLTAALLPNLAHSKAMAQELHNLGLEIILHLPMEPKELYRLEKNTIMISMDEAMIKRIVEEDLANLLYARGVSNHMGSLATQDIKIMSVVFNQLKNKRLYFLDSLVSTKSICALLAKKIGVEFAKRDIFLDNIGDPEYIRGQIYKLKTKARFNGAAVGIGHDRKHTLEVLKEELPKLEKEGFKFVFVSDLITR